MASVVGLDVAKGLTEWQEFLAEGRPHFQIIHTTGVRPRD